MKKIQPVQIWINGATQIATYFTLTISFDDLHSSCTFFYQLINEDTKVSIGYGDLLMIGEDYLNWDGSTDKAYEYALTRLNLTLADI
jgi:hypothetical protein